MWARSPAPVTPVPQVTRVHFMVLGSASCTRPRCLPMSSIHSVILEVFDGIAVAVEFYGEVVPLKRTAVDPGDPTTVKLFRLPWATEQLAYLGARACPCGAGQSCASTRGDSRPTNKRKPCTRRTRPVPLSRRYQFASISFSSFLWCGFRKYTPRHPVHVLICCGFTGKK